MVNRRSNLPIFLLFKSETDTELNIYIKDSLPLLLRMWPTASPRSFLGSQGSPRFMESKSELSQEYRGIFERHCPKSWPVDKLADLTSSYQHAGFSAWLCSAVERGPDQLMLLRMEFPFSNLSFHVESWFLWRLSGPSLLLPRRNGTGSFWEKNWESIVYLLPLFFWDLAAYRASFLHCPPRAQPPCLEEVCSGPAC